MKFKTTINLLVASLLTLSTLAAANHSCCPRGAVKVTNRTIVVTPTKPTLIAMLQPMPTFQASDIFRKMIQAPVSTQEAGKNENCPHNRAVWEWKAWRVRNPHAHSRYDRNVSALSPEPTPDEPEPDPAGLGCGCDVSFSLSGDGCGWFHSQVYGQ